MSGVDPSVYVDVVRVHAPAALRDVAYFFEEASLTAHAQRLREHAAELAETPPITSLMAVGLAVVRIEKAQRIMVEARELAMHAMYIIAVAVDAALNRADAALSDAAAVLADLGRELK